MGRSIVSSQDRDDADPLTLALAPPPDETPAQRQVREFSEAQARKISLEIDEQLRKERDDLRKKKRPVKLLLLGQSESGKSATLKNFQLTYAAREWIEERNSWRSIIFLNLVRNVNHILQELSTAMAETQPSTDSSNSSSDEHSAPTASSSKAVMKTKKSKSRRFQFTDRHSLLALRLGPLRRIQSELEHTLGNAAMEPKWTDVTSAAPFDRTALQEFSINSTNGWKTALEKFRGRSSSEKGGNELSMRRRLKSKEDEVAEVISGCRDDIKALWEDDVVQDLLSSKKERIEDAAGFFIADADRIATRHYQPTDDDIIRARLRTLGVQEYRFVFEKGRTAGQEWRLYDVGGTRSSRAAWYPYFEDVDAIIFLAPISCFDEKLAEDRRVNRLEDSYLLWRSVCSCKLLARTQIILFLNKIDLLQAKLDRGVKIRDAVPSYGERKNDPNTAAKYFQQHFKEILKQYSPVQRTFYVHHTSVVDTRATAVTLGAVEESILRDHLRRADLM